MPTYVVSQQSVTQTTTTTVNIEGGYNDLLIKWLTEWRDIAKRTGSKIEFTYLKALKSVREHNEPLRSGAECKKLRGFGDKICAAVDKKLKEHLGDAYNPPGLLDNLLKSPAKRCRGRNATATSTLLSDSSTVQSDITRVFAVRKRLGNGLQCSAKSPSVSSPIRKVARATNQRNYIPAQGSSGFAILVALLRYELEYRQKLVNKLDIQEMAQRYSSSMVGQTNVSTSRYNSSGWNTIKTLLSKELVAKTDARNSYYYLTEEGKKLARNLALVSPALLDFSEKYLNNQPVNGQLAISDDECDSDVISDSDSAVPAPSTASPEPTYRPFVFEPGSYEIILCIDTRERIQTNFCQENRAAFAAALQKQDVRVEIRMLPLGDFVWVAREKSKAYANDLVRFASMSTDMNAGQSCSSTASAGSTPSDVRKELVLDLIVERKRVDDLASSIKDRRWDEQKHRLKNCGLRRPTYLIEYSGKQSRKSDFGGLKPETLEQAIANCEIDGFDVKRTDNFEETVRYLTFMTRWLERKYTNRMLMSCVNKEELAKTVASDFRYITFNEFAVNSGKLQTFTAKEMFVKHLLQIKGLSLGKINCIVGKYPTLRRLMEAYERKPDLHSKHNLLTDLRSDLVVGANRRLGPAISKKVHDYYRTE